MSKSTLMVSFIGIIILTAAASGCHSPAPNVHFTAPIIDLGRVALGQSKEATVTAINDGDLDAVLGDVTDAGIKLDAPFNVTGGTCKSGMRLTQGASCTLIVRFTPSHFGDYTDKIELHTTAEDYNETPTATVRGTGFVDCNTTQVLAANYQTGSTEAQERNEHEALSGKAAGDALTYDDGYQKGYKDAYSRGLNDGYNSTYDAAYDSGFNQGYSQGLNDSSSCSLGAASGAGLGYIDGRATGESDGYNDGYDDGYASGYDSGYYDGYDAGANSCSFFAKPSEQRKPLPKKLTGPASFSPTPSSDPFDTAENQQNCYDQGYAATYDPNSYWKAYDAAAKMNAPYQNGLSVGSSQGYSDGTAEGKARGISEGTANGKADGFADGSDVAYNDCYTTAYNAAWDVGYYVGYNDSFNGYDAGYDDGDSYGYNVGWDVGYDDGEYDYCTDSSDSARRRDKKKVNTFGRGQKWAITKAGITVSNFINPPLPLRGLLNAEQKASIVATINKVRSKAKTEWRPMLRVKMLRSPKHHPQY